MHTADNTEQQGTPTPRTDAEIGAAYLAHGVNWVSGDFARQLERELAAKTVECERLREAAIELVLLWDSAKETEETMEEAIRKLDRAALKDSGNG